MSNDRPQITFAPLNADLAIRPGPGVAVAEVARRLGDRALVDRSGKFLRAKPIDFELARSALADLGDIRLEFDPAPALDLTPRLTIEARDYQREAVEAWLAEGGRGVVVLPTGAGKTVVAALAIERLGLATLVVVPTIDLLNQWQSALARYLDAPTDAIGRVGGGRLDFRAITISTYDSATIRRRQLWRFGLIVFDEVHHLPAISYRAIAEAAHTPHRLGLSATPERADAGELALTELVGEVVYRREAAALSAAGALAAYREQRVMVDLDADEQAEYDRLIAVYKRYQRSRGVTIRSLADYQRLLIQRSGRDPLAREALLAHGAARRLALGPNSKVEAVRQLLERHRDDKVIVFCEYNDIVDRLAEALLLPAVTYRTERNEREEIVSRFRSGRYSKIVAGRVLNEGVDVPDARIAIVVSGSGVRREQIQRLGRVLRPKVGEAVLYELVTKGTREVEIARRRGKATDGSGAETPRRAAESRGGYRATEPRPRSDDDWLG